MENNYCSRCDQTNVILSEDTMMSEGSKAFVDLRFDMDNETPSLDIQYGLLNTGTDTDKVWSRSIPMKFCFNCGRDLGKDTSTRP